MSSLNPIINAIDSTISAGWNALGRARTAVKTTMVNNNINMASTRGMGKAAWSNAKMASKDVYNRSGLMSGRGAAVVGGGAVAGAVYGGVTARNGDGFSGTLKGALGGASLGALGMMGKGAWSSSKNGMGPTGALNTMGKEAWTKSAGIRGKIATEWKTRAAAGASEAS